MPKCALPPVLPPQLCNIFTRYDQSDYNDAQPVNSCGVGISVLRFLLLLFLGYMAAKSYQATVALENKSFLKIFFCTSFSWQLVICICIMASISSDTLSQMISVWASTLTFNFLYLSSVCYLLMHRWTDVPAGTKEGLGKKQPFIDDETRAAGDGSYQAGL